MALTRAEIQRNYRQRKKEKEGEKYLEKERQRQRRNYIPVALLSSSAQKKRNRKINERVRKHRKNKKERQEIPLQEDDAVENLPESSGYESMSASVSNERELLQVRLPILSARRNGPKKRLSKALSKAHREIKKLKSENDNLQRKVKTIQRRVQRMKNKQAPATPRSKTDKMMKEHGLDGRARNVRKQLLMSNVIIDEVNKKMKDKKAGKKKIVYGQVVGNLLKKYRCISKLSKATGLHRNVISRAIKRGVDFTKQRRLRTLAKYREGIIMFLEREDNSRSQPGKQDSVKCESGRLQTRVLTDYLDNLYLKYKSEKPEIAVSLSTFKRARPKYILPTTFLSRNTCLCTKHQNFVFKLKMLKKEGIEVSTNPEEYVRKNVAVDTSKLPEVTFSLWKRVQLENGKKKMKIVQETMKSVDFSKIWEKEENEFKEHVFKIKTQYSQLRQLKENLPEKEILLHMDFAENYSCKTADEIQSAYWNQSQVTLHPIVVYFKDQTTKKLAHRSYVAISDCMQHSSSTVLAILDTFYGLNLDECAGVEHVHDWTDSPTSQYRNRYIFEAILTHKEKYGSNATWNYFEAGHGKGPCDGVGGTVKRMADEAVNSSRVSIQDPEEFMTWAKQSTMKGVHFFFVKKEDCEKKFDETKSCKLKPVKGTMNLHACKRDMNLLVTSQTSCYCDCCLKHLHCENWSITSAYDDEISEVPTVSANNETLNDQIPSLETVNSTKATDVANSHAIPQQYEVGSFVAAMYEGNWYVGQIMSVDESDKEIEISFMEQKKNFFQWPRTEDKIWVNSSDIVCQISPLKPCGKSKRMYKMDIEDKNNVEKLLTK